MNRKESIWHRLWDGSWWWVDGPGRLKWKPKSKQSDYKSRCRSCGCQREFGGDGNEFHCIPDVNGIGWALIYCEICNARLSIPEKKEFIWNLCGGVYNEAQALHQLERSRHLCAQIDKGL